MDQASESLRRLEASRLRTVEESLRRLEDEVEGRLSRSLVQLGNSRDAIRDHVGEAVRATHRALRAGQAEAVPAVRE